MTKNNSFYFLAPNDYLLFRAFLVFGSSPMVAGMPPVAVAMQKHVMEHVKIAAEEQAMAQMQQMGPMDADQQEMQ